MNLTELQKKLLTAARTAAPSEHVPVAFEKRVLAHLPPRPAVDLSAWWARALWRAVVPCVALTVGLLVVAGTLTTEVASGSTELVQAFEQTLLAAADSGEENW